jgi:hypothetical protein
MSDGETGAPPAPQTPGEAKPAVDLPAQARKEASWALFALAGLPAAFTAMSVLIPRLLGVQVDPSTLAEVLAWTVGLAVAFAGLGVWARSRPLPPAVLGLALYVVLVVKSAVLGLVLCLLAALLVKSIHTSLKARRR